MAVNQVNLLGPVAQQPLDIQAEQAKLALAQKIAEALLLKSSDTSVGPPSFATSPGNPFSRTVPNIGGPVGDIITAFRNKGALEDITNRQAALAKELQGRESVALTDYFKQKYGQQGEALPEGEQGPPTPTRAPDPIGAIITALNSGLPGPMKIAEEDRKGIPSAKDILQYGQHFDPAALQRYSTNLQPAELTGRGKVGEAGGVLYSSKDEKVLEKQPVEKFSDVRELAPGIAGATGDITNKPVMASVNTAQNAYAKQYGQDVLDRLKTSTQGYLGASTTMQIIGQTREYMKSIPENAYGSLGEFRQGVGKFFEMLGAAPNPKINSIEGLQRQLGQVMLDRIRALAPVTKEDVAQMQQIIGSIGSTRRGLEQALNDMQTVAENTIERHKRLVMSVPPPTKEIPGMTQSMHEAIWSPDIQPKINLLQPTGNVPGVKSRKQLYDELGLPPPNGQ